MLALRRDATQVCCVLFAWRCSRCSPLGARRHARVHTSRAPAAAAAAATVHLHLRQGPCSCTVPPVTPLPLFPLPCCASPQVNHEDFNEAITEVQAKKKASLQYYA